MDVMRFCAAAAAAILFATAATGIATAQIESSPAFKVVPPKKKPVRKAPPQAVPPPSRRRAEHRSTDRCGARRCRSRADRPG